MTKLNYFQKHSKRRIQIKFTSCPNINSGLQLFSLSFQKPNYFVTFNIKHFSTVLSNYSEQSNYDIRQNFDLTEKQKESIKFYLPQVEIVLKYFRNNNSIYLNNSQLQLLHNELVLDSKNNEYFRINNENNLLKEQLNDNSNQESILIEFSIQETLNIVNRTRFILRNPSKALSQEEKDYISIYIQNLKGNRDVLSICEALNKEINVSRSQLYQYVRNCINSLERNNLSSDTKFKIRKYLQDSNELNEQKLCDELETIFGLSRNVLQRIVYTELNRKQRLELTKLQRKEIRAYIEYYLNNFSEFNANKKEMNNTFPSISQICEFLIEKYPNIRYELICQFTISELNRLKKNRISNQQKISIKNQLKEILKESPTLAISKICDQIPNNEGLSKRQLYMLIYYELKRLNLKPILNEDMLIIKDIIKQYIKIEKPSFIVNKILEKVQYNREQINKIVQSEFQKKNSPKATKEQIEYIKSYVESRESIDNIALICDELEELVSIPRKIIWKIVLSEVESQLFKRVTKEQREYIQNYVKKSNSKSILDICDELQSFLSLKRRIIYELVRIELIKKLSKAISEKDKSIIFEIVTTSFYKKLESIHKINPNNLFNELGINTEEKSLIDQIQINLSIPRKIIRDLVRKKWISLFNYFKENNSK